MLYFKKVKLHPTTFSMDVLSCEDDNKLISFIKKRYGLLDHQIDIEQKDFVCMISCGPDSEISDRRRMFMRLNSPNDREAIVHELVHVLHVMSEHTKIEVGSESQEWQALFTEMLFREICKPNYDKL